MDRDTFKQPEIKLIDKLSKWDGGDGSDCLAPLSVKQKDSFLDLASIASNRSMPIEVPLEEPVNIAHKVPVKGVLVPGSTEDILAQGFSSLGMAREKIENAQQFYSWFSKIEEQMGVLEAEDYMEHVKTLKNYRDHCQYIVKDVQSALEALDKLETEYVFVSTKTNALHEACEQLLADQTALINTADAIQENLEYFVEHDRISTKLSSPNLQVTGESFQAMLSRIDECIEFMKAHATYKDSTTYMAKYKTSLSAALGMIKSFVVKSLESTTQAILRRKNENAGKTVQGNGDASSGADDAFTLYYGKFRTNAPKIKGLMEQIEARVEKNEEYQHLLSDIHYCYFTQREWLLSPSVTSAMTDLVNINKQDHCALVRSGCAFMVHVCEDEHQLYSHFFSASSIKLHEMLLRLCGNLYDLLRPLIIHVYHLETLAELCNILKTEMIDDHVQNNPEQLQAFHSVALQMLEDVQERLVYRANIYVRDDIRSYKFSPGDIAYPEKLEMMEEIARNLKQAKHEEGAFTEIKLDESDPGSGLGELDDSVSSVSSMRKSQQSNKFQTSPADMHGMWFPTVRRVLVCLSKLYRCIDKTIFQGLSQEALEACVQSLVGAANAIKNRTKPNSTEKKVVDGQLFLIKHLLILREQIAPFHAEFAIKETQLDFSRTKDAAFRFVLEPRSLSNLLKVNSSNSLLQLLYEGTPEVKEYYIDSKKDVDRQLKLVCEEFIQHQTDKILGPLKDFLQKASHLLNMSTEDGGHKTSLRQQQFATPEVLHNLVGQIYRDLKLNVKKTVASMGLYLANKETENILFKPIKLNVQHAFQQLHSLLLDNYTEEDRAIVAAPSSDQVGVASISNFALNQSSTGKSLHYSCLLQICFTMTPCIASIFSITVVGLDRYFSIMNPLKYHMFMSLYKGTLIVFVIWLASVLLGFAPLMGWGVLNQDYLNNGSICTYLYVVDLSYVIFSLFGVFLPQLLVIVYLYVQIFKVSRKHRRQISQVSLPQSRLSRARNSDDSVSSQRRPSPRFTQSCPVTPVMPRIRVTAFQAHELAQKLRETSRRKPHRTVSFSPASFQVTDEPSESVSSDSAISFKADSSDPTNESVFDDSFNLPGSVYSPKQIPKITTTHDLSCSSAGNMSSNANNNNSNASHKLRRTVSYGGSMVISSLTSQLSSRFKSYGSLRKLNFKRDVKALRTVALVVGFFFIMWSPFLIVSVVQMICGSSCELQNLVGTYLFVLGVANSAINPIVYTYTNRELKSHILRLCRKSSQLTVVTDHEPSASVHEIQTNLSSDFLTVPTSVWRNTQRGSLLSNMSVNSIPPGRSPRTSVVSVSAEISTLSQVASSGRRCSCHFTNSGPNGAFSGNVKSDIRKGNPRYLLPPIERKASVCNRPFATCHNSRVDESVIVSR